jgi:hypothetical protein
MSRNSGSGGSTQPPAPPAVDTPPAAQAEKASQADQPPQQMTMGDLAGIIGAAVAQGVASVLTARDEAAKAEKEANEPPPPDPREAQTELESQLSEDRYLITISKGDKGSVDPVPIGVNGITRTIKRGDYAIVTASMLEVLDNSQEEKIDEETREPFKVHSYPYSVVRKLEREDWPLTVAELQQKYLPDRNRLAH